MHFYVQLIHLCLNAYKNLINISWKLKAWILDFDLSFSTQREKPSSFIAVKHSQINRLKARPIWLKRSIKRKQYQQHNKNSNKMLAKRVQTTHPVQDGYACRQFYGNDHQPRAFKSNNGFDVTDNRTNELHFKPIYTMNDSFHREDERQKTFEYWPLEWLDKYQLAQTGMFYTGEGDRTKCYFCEVVIGCWEQQDKPVEEHLRWSPNCPLLRRRTTNNVPVSIEALDRLLPPMSYDICGANDEIEVRENACSEGTIASTNNTTSANLNTAPSCSTTTYFPEFPEYSIEAARLRSFGEWPVNMKPKPEQLAEAGFFYTGVGDRVKCFSCGGGLKDWDENDDPWEQHALWLNRCRFVKLMKGETYIDTIEAKQKAKEAGEVACAMAPELLKSTATASTEKPTVGQQLAAIQSEKSNFIVQSCQTSAEAIPAVPTIKDESAGCDETTKFTNASLAERRTHSHIPEEKLCKICYADEYNTAFLPCGHVVACAKCASSVTKCPMCRKPFTDVMRVYFS